jgi:hypothetical protein
LGIPSERDLFVFLPRGYDESDRLYPTAYLLHAYGDSADRLVTPATDGQRWWPPIEDVRDPVFGRMGVTPMIVVIPDGNSRYGTGVPSRGRWLSRGCFALAQQGIQDGESVSANTGGRLK